jgi:hypothetical protein
MSAGIKKKKVLVTVSYLFVQERAEDVEVISVPERSSHEGLQVLEFEYRIDSTRTGMQRILSTAFVSSKKLYLFNITHSYKLESPLDASTGTIFRRNP